MTERLRQLYPLLETEWYEVRSVQTPEYNCVAFAANDTENWWQPAPHPFLVGYWPEGAPRRNNIGAWMAAFRTLGYTECEDGEHEQRVEKVAMYAKANGQPTHVARQTEAGEWVSKLGDLEDIAHTLVGLEGENYGSVVKFMKRARPAT